MNHPDPLALLFVMLFAPTLVAEPPRIIIGGWDSPTSAQLARDAAQMQSLPFDGCILDIKPDVDALPHPFWNAHSSETWENLSFDRAIEELRTASPGKLSSNYLIVKANPGDVDWLDDKGWKSIVEHWRTAARIAKQGRLRGLVFDPEPYTAPYEQFRYYSQRLAKDHPFEEYRDAARRRGREVMKVIAEEFPDVELLSYFLMSYLVRDHRYRGASPVDREDEALCLAGHSYGLLPAFLDGWLDELPPDAVLYDGCEYAYWHKTSSLFFEEARDVRQRGIKLVSRENREKYAAQVKVAFPIYLDAVHPTLAGRYVLEPEQTDRLSLLRRNLSAAIDHGDGLVWIYGEQGRWWPPAGDTALYANRTVYPEWDSLIPGCLEAIRTVVQESGVRESGNREVSPAWSTWVEEGKPGTVEVLDGRVEIRGAVDAAALAAIDVNFNERYTIRVRVRCKGRGRSALAIRWRSADEKWIEDNQHDKVIFPPDGTPSAWRMIETEITVPAGVRQLVAICSGQQQFGNSDLIEFQDLAILRQSNAAP